MRRAALVFATIALGAATASASPKTEAQREAWFDAARDGDVGALAKLRKAKVAVDAIDDSGYSALVLAAYHDRGAAVTWLLARGADPCVADKRGYTALMGAVFRGHGEVVGLLAAKPCGADHVTPAGQTPLMLAALFGRAELVKALLASGADPARADGDGRTARSLADGQGLTEIVALLDAALAAKR